MSVERRCSRLPEGRADMKNSLSKVHRRARTSGMGTARRRLVDRSGPRSHVGPPAASQRVQDGHTGRWSSYLRKHVGDHGHNRAPRAGTRRRRRTPLKVSLRASVRQGSSACTGTPKEGVIRTDYVARMIQRCDCERVGRVAPRILTKARSPRCARRNRQLWPLASS